MIYRDVKMNAEEKKKGKRGWLKVVVIGLGAAALIAAAVMLIGQPGFP